MIDLHTHTNISDGTDTPAQLINKALASGINVLALTDHDSIAGWNEATLHLRPGLDLVLGAEISCQTEDGISVHMLGLLFDSAHQELQEVLAQTRENRHGRMEKIIGRMNSAGIEISMVICSNYAYNLHHVKRFANYPSRAIISRCNHRHALQD